MIRALHFYTNIFKNFDVLKGVGLLSDERIEEIKAWVAPERFIAPELKSGKTIQGYILHEPTGKMFSKFGKEEWEEAYSEHWIQENVLLDLLTVEEIEKLNKNASELWSRKVEAERFERAEKVAAADYDGWIYSEGHGYNEGYFESVEDLKEWIGSEQFWDRTEDAGEEAEFPKYVWATRSKPCCQLDLYRIIENATSDTYEEYNGPVGVEELQKAIDAFNKLNEDDLSYETDYKKAIIL